MEKALGSGEIGGYLEQVKEVSLDLSVVILDFKRGVALFLEDEL